MSSGRGSVPLEPISSAMPISAVLTMFYYNDIDAAARWYEEKLGFLRVSEGEGFVILGINGVAGLTLVSAGFGSQQVIAGPNKGAILSIQTDDLERWHAVLFDRQVDGAGEGVKVGAGGRTLEFKVLDPEGYTIEFFEWL